eukprot:3496161-Pyramimonas_sp.AAC.1
MRGDCILAPFIRGVGRIALSQQVRQAVDGVQLVGHVFLRGKPSRFFLLSVGAAVQEQMICDVSADLVLHALTGLLEGLAVESVNDPLVGNAAVAVNYPVVGTAVVAAVHFLV